MKNSFKFFKNTDCVCFPCHEGVDPDRFNCLFCFCPLYFLGERCGGDFEYTSKNIKCCTRCRFPHEPDNYETIIERLKEINAPDESGDAFYLP